MFAGDCDSTNTSVMLDPWCPKARRSRITEFVKKAARKLHEHRDGIDGAIERGLSNDGQEGLSSKACLPICSACDFHSPEAALATVILTCGPVNLKLPYHNPTTNI